MKWLLLTLFILVGCNSEKPELGEIQGLRDPSNPIPYITSITTSNVPGTFLLGNTITFDVAFSEEVTVTGAPSIRVRTDDGVYQAYFVSGTPTVLTFQYTVAAGQYDSDGINLQMPLLLNGGNISEPETGDTVLLTFIPPNLTGYLVRAATPTLTSITPPAVGTYGPGTTLSFAMNYNMPVNVTGTPRFLVEVAGGVYFANFTSGSGTTTLNFLLSTPPSRSGAVTILSALTDLNGGTILDDFSIAANNSFPATSMAGVNVDTIAPTIPGAISVPANATYNNGQNLDFIVTFDEPVEIVGTNPSLAITLNSGAVVASYHSISSDNLRITFRYTVAAGHTDPDGIVVSTTVTNFSSIEDIHGNALASGLISVPSTAGVLVATNPPTMTAMTAPPATTYRTGNNLDFVATFSSAVTVTGTPHLTYLVGGVSSNATYLSGSGTTQLTFRFTVPAGRTGTVSLSGGTISLNAGAIRDVYNTNADLTVAATSYAGILIDSTPPTVSGPITVPANATYYTGQPMDFSVTFNEPILNAASTYLRMTIGSSTVNVPYQSTSGDRRTVTYRYSVQTGDIDTNGIAVITAISGYSSIQDDAGNALAAGTISVPSTTSVLVDGVAPTVSTISTTTTSGTYPGNTGFVYRVNFSEAITIGGSIYLNTSIDGSTVTSSACSAIITYLQCVVTAPVGGEDLSGIEVVSLDVGAGTIRDGGAGSNNAVTTFTTTNFPGHKIDDVGPTVSSYTYVTASGAHTGTITIDITFHEPVAISGTPRIQVSLDGTTQYFNYLSYSGSTIRFQYNTTGTYSFNGITHNNVIDLNGGYIRDSASNNASLDISGLDLTRYRFIPGGLAYWYDPNDALTTTTTAGSPTTFKSIASTALNGVFTGTPTFATLNGKRILNVGGGNWILLNGTIPSQIYYIVMVMKAPAAGVSGEAFIDLASGNYKWDFDAASDVYLGAGCPFKCNYYRDATNAEQAGSGGIAFTATPGQYYFAVFETGSATFTNAQLAFARAGWTGGQIGDIMIFTGNVLTSAIKSQIKNYVDNKYGAGNVIYPPAP